MEVKHLSYLVVQIIVHFYIFFLQIRLKCFVTQTHVSLRCGFVPTSSEIILVSNVELSLSPVRIQSLVIYAILEMKF